MEQALGSVFKFLWAFKIYDIMLNTQITIITLQILKVKKKVTKISKIK